MSRDGGRQAANQLHIDHASTHSCCHTIGKVYYNISSSMDARVSILIIRPSVSCAAARTMSDILTAKRPTSSCHLSFSCMHHKSEGCQNWGHPSLRHLRMKIDICKNHFRRGGHCCVVKLVDQALVDESVLRQTSKTPQPCARDQDLGWKKEDVCISLFLQPHSFVSKFTIRFSL